MRNVAHPAICRALALGLTELRLGFIIPELGGRNENSCHLLEILLKYSVKHPSIK